jgi:hypothetical protein
MKNVNIYLQMWIFALIYVKEDYKQYNQPLHTNKNNIQDVISWKKWLHVKYLELFL